jgi:hypothetical protein
MDFKWRKSYAKDDSLLIAKQLAKIRDINPYTVDELGGVITSGARVGELIKEKKGQSYVLKNVDKWFDERLMPNTIVLSIDDYKRALFRAFKLITTADIAKTDFGSSRQRDFGQMWTDFTRGFLGEIGIEKFFNNKLNLEIELEESEVGDVEKYLPTDIIKVKEGEIFREVKTNISIKTSKLKSMWLDIGTQLAHSDAFIFIKIGLTTDHLVSFMKDNGFIDKIIEMGKELNEIQDVEETKKEIFSKVENTRALPAYISGFALKKDMEEGILNIHVTPKNKTIIGGIGLYDNKQMANKVEGLGDISPPKYMASIGSLRWSISDWDNMKKSI